MIAMGPLGDRAYLARFETEDEAARWASAVRALGWPGVVDVVPAYRTAAVFADPDRIDLDGLGRRLRDVVPSQDDRDPGRLIRVPVLYDGEDLPAVTRRLGMAESEVVAAHAGTVYHVFAVGFRPGFPYAGLLPDRLAGLPRREVPRVRVPAGSVAIVARQTVIYPDESPGGWHLLGRTPLRIVDVEAGFFPIRAGDRLRFVPIDRHEFDARCGERLTTDPPFPSPRP
jgi:KipI family sensor histidine kinase inhibitor